jgi:hypothetical protein
MSKGQMRTPPPVPALTEKDRAYLNWIQRNRTHLVRSALKLYRMSGWSSKSLTDTHSDAST